MKRAQSASVIMSVVLALIAIPVGAQSCKTAPSAAAKTGIPAVARSDQTATTEDLKSGGGYPVVDTAQDACYDASSEIPCPVSGSPFFGQDAQNEGNAPHYQDNGDGTVTDLVTGLMWSKSPDLNGDGTIDAFDKLGYDEALASAGSVTLAGYSDWRLPTIKELYSLIDFTGVDPSEFTTVGGALPFIDDGVFDFAYGDTAVGERIIDAQFASSTLYVSTTMDGNATMFGVNFADGRIKGYPATRKTFYVLYVRGNPEYGRNDFEDNGDGTITDHATGLMWARQDSGSGMNWEQALAWVEQLNHQRYLGYSDWRLPDAKELESIVDYNRSPDTTGSAAIDPMFEATAIVNEGGQADYPWYWTSTTHLRDWEEEGSAGVYVAFGRAMGYMFGQWLDVHGAGAQRSDPKEGDPAQFPYGRGPQGDAIRIFNYVRPVRTVDESSTNERWIPAVARVQGAGAVFTSRLELFNPSGQDITVEAEFTPRDDFGGDSRSATLDLPAGQMATIDDPLGTWLGLDEGENSVGSLRLTADPWIGGGPMATSVMTARQDDGREYGQAFPAHSPDEALGPGETAFLSTAVDPGKTRVNFGVAALADGTVLEVVPVDPTDTPIGEALAISLDRGESTQFNDVAGRFGLGERAGYLLEVTVDAGSALVYGSVVDGTVTSPGTSDPTTISPVTSGAEQVTLLELGEVAGYDEFAGSASISNLSDRAAQLVAEFHRRDVPGVAASAALDIPAGETLVYQDLVGELFGMTDVGSVVLSSVNGTEIMANGREYAIVRDAAGTQVGTAGQLMRGLVSTDLLQPGITYDLLGLRQRQTDRGLERSHVAAFNPGDSAVHLTLDLYDGSSGEHLGSMSLDVPGGQLAQVNGIIETMDPAQDGVPKRIALATDGPVFAAGFLVNADGDPVTVEPMAEGR